MTEQLVELLKQLQEIAPHIWAIYVRQQYVVVVADSIWTVVLGIFAYMFFKLGRWSRSKARALLKEKPYSDDFGWITLEVLVYASCALAIFIIPFVFTDGVMRIVNPQYYAIQSLLNAVK